MSESTEMEPCPFGYPIGRMGIPSQLAQRHFQEPGKTCFGPLDGFSIVYCVSVRIGIEMENFVETLGGF